MVEMIMKHFIPPFSVSLEYPVRGPTKQHRNQGQWPWSSSSWDNKDVTQFYYYGSLEVIPQTFS